MTPELRCKGEWEFEERPFRQRGQLVQGHRWLDVLGSDGGGFRAGPWGWREVRLRRCAALPERVAVPPPLGVMDDVAGVKEEQRLHVCSTEGEADRGHPGQTFGSAQSWAGGPRAHLPRPRAAQQSAIQ